MLDGQNIPVRLVEGTGVRDFLEHCSAD
jgi:hypothetical protein